MIEYSYQPGFLYQESTLLPICKIGSFFMFIFKLFGNLLINFS
jgi:hypothetical protein